MIVRSKDLVNKRLLSLYPNVKAVVSATSGFDHFDVSLVKKSENVFFGHTPKANITSCSELTLMHALNLFKSQKEHLKARADINLSLELKDKTALIIGFGRIGKQVATLLKAFRVRVKAYDPYVFKKDFAELNVEPVTLEEGLSSSDLVSLHCPLTLKTKHMVNLSFLNSMREGSFLINCARGSLVSEASLLSALKKRRLKGAALDVLEEEPLSIDSPLRNFKNVYLSPHIGGYSFEAHNNSALEALTQVEAVLNQNKSDLSPLPLETEWYKDLNNLEVV